MVVDRSFACCMLQFEVRIKIGGTLSRPPTRRVVVQRIENFDPPTTHVILSCSISSSFTTPAY